MSDFRISLEKRNAKKLLSALQKGKFDDLTRAELNALEDLITDLLMEVG
jgi:hypothetical protein